MKIQYDDDKVKFFKVGVGKSYTKTYWTWRNILLRCSSKNTGHSKNYLNKGITVCKRWKNYDNFLKDMGQKPIGMSIDRKNNKKGYSPSNCRWASPRTQSRNRSFCRPLTHLGKTQLLSDWARELKTNVSTISMRIDYYGWSIEKALEKKNV